MKNLFFYLFATLFITAGLFNQWQQVECVAADNTLQDDELTQDELLLDPLNEGGTMRIVEGKFRRAWRN
jgi:hypothetical protein